MYIKAGKRWVSPSRYVWPECVYVLMSACMCVCVCYVWVCVCYVWVFGLAQVSVEFLKYMGMLEVCDIGISLM